ncbi:MAG: 4Fe-4S dicluster domain-containing protein [Spirochaetales bacterium]|nr:4Fe-4S dicluster domain-containing protein [Spirochaetales bacterium]
MMYSNYGPSLVKTIKERCRVCYTCVRECPAKAIRVAGGQAEVIAERCIGCGNCTRVCSQQAKAVLNSMKAVKALLASDAPVAACLAPSFPAEFTEYSHRVLAGRLRAMGFARVVETSFGADLVAAEYKKLVAENGGRPYISTACPAIVSYVEKYFPHLIAFLAPVLSPMGAAALVVKKLYGEGMRVVFIGPCIAKKNEAKRIADIVAVDAVLTFSELRMLLEEAAGADGSGALAPEADFDPPHPRLGTIFPLGGGLLQAAAIERDLIANKVISTEGNRNFVEVIRDFDASPRGVELLDILCCEGCVMGPGMTTTEARFARHERVSAYARLCFRERDQFEWDDAILDWSSLSLACSFEADDRRLDAPPPGVIRAILERMGKRSREDELNCGACGYETCVEHAVAIHKGFAETEMCLPYAVDKFKENAKELSVSYRQLEEAQAALIQSEKLASMGQLAAGIAHEINNPLGVILLYAHLLFDRAASGSEHRDDLKMIVEQADRCKTIVGGLLNFARKNKAVLQRADLAELVGRCVKAAKSSASLAVEFENPDEPVHADVDPEQMMQVFINLFTNAIEAMPRGGTLRVRTSRANGEVSIRVSDSGVGIPSENQKKIFEPFYTTKQMGKGTGLGLAVTYGIIKMHRGNIEVESNADPEQGPTGTTFVVTLPVRQEEA